MTLNVETTLALAAGPGPTGPGPLTVSASSLEKAATCRRMWWFDAVLKLPRIESTEQQAFGTTLHAVVARWLEADDQGRDVTGLPVNLYPMAWDAAIKPFEADLIKRLVEKAIAEGVLERDPHRYVETKFHGPMPGAQGVDVVGFVDVAVLDPEKPAVWDHKTHGRADYVKSPAYLKTDTQMVLYAKVLSEQLAEMTGSRPKEVRIGHNAFVKDENDLRVRKVRTTITAEEIDARYGELVTLAHEMMHLRDRGYSPDDWARVPEATNLNTCNRYFGKPCDFVSICAGVVSPQEYAARIEKRLANTPDPTITVHAPSTTGPKETVTTMGLSALESRLAAKSAINAAAGANAPPPTTAINPPPPSATAAAVATTPTVTAAPAPAPSSTAGAPWAFDNCDSCKGTGFSAGKDPCRICSAKRAAKDGPLVGWFVVEYVNGEVFWEPKAEYAGKPGAVGGSLRIASAEIKAEHKTTPPATNGAAPAPTPATAAPAPTPAKRTRKKGLESPTAAPEPAQAAPAPSPAPTQGPQAATTQTVNTGAPTVTLAPAATADTTAAPAETATEDTTTKRRKKGFTLCVRCIPMGVTKYVDLDEVLYNAGRELAAAKGLPSFYAIPYFDRKDLIGQVVEKLVEPFGTQYVVAASSAQDMKDLLAAIRPLADVVIEGIAA